MSVSEPYDDRLLADLAAAADGTLPPARQAEVEALAAGDAGVAAALDEQRRALTLIRGATAELRAPLELRERLEADRERASRIGGARFRRRWFSIGLAGAVAAAVLLATVLVAPNAPTLQDAAAFGGLPPTGDAPAAQGKLLDAAQDGVRFPEWGAKFGWKATGTRTGEIEGRPATTVYYEKDGKTIAYTIVGGDALDVPDDARTVNVEGTEIALFATDDGRPAATWERNGHTCVLAGAGVPDDKLSALAGWKGLGAVEF
jgi:hypothetical protein